MRIYTFLMASVLAATPFAQAGSDGAEAALLRGITLCPSPNNPLTDGLKALGGNLFAGVDVQVTDSNPEITLIRASAVSSPRAMNLAIGAPDRIVGSIELRMSYGTPGNGPRFDRALHCALKALDRDGLAPASSDAGFTLIESGAHGSSRAQTGLAVSTTQAGWLTVLESVYGRAPTNTSSASIVDFASEVGVAYVDEHRSSGGYRLIARKARILADRVELHIDAVSPGPNCIVTLALTRPYLLLKLPANDGKMVVPVIKNVVKNCD